MFFKKKTPMQRLVAAHTRMEEARSDLVLHLHDFISDALKVANGFALRNKHQKVIITGKHQEDDTYVIEALIGEAPIAQVVLDVLTLEARFSPAGGQVHTYRFQEYGQAINALGHYVEDLRPEAAAAAA